MWEKFQLFGLHPVVYMIKADISRLYLVQNVGLWGSPLLLRSHHSCSYKRLTTTAYCRTKLPQSHSATQMRTGSDKPTNKKERERKCLPSMQVSPQPKQSCQRKWKLKQYIRTDHSSLIMIKSKSKSLHVQSYSGSEGSRSFWLPDFKTISTRRW
jgi:hypothetical protein